MGKLRQFDIVFEHPQGVFSAGKTLIGNVLVELSEPMKMRNIRLFIHGRSKVHWTTNKHDDNTVHYRAEEIYIDQTVIVWGTLHNDGLPHAAGLHAYPFEIPLHKDLPSSFEGEYGYVRYLCTATIDKPWKFNHSVKAAFTVLSLLDLNFEPGNLHNALQCEDQTDVECCCCVAGDVQASFRINRKGFVPGECIMLNAVISNNSNTSVHESYVALKQFVDFYGKSDSFLSSGTLKPKGKIIQVARIDRGCIEAGKKDVWDNIPLHIPAIPPSRLDGCNIIKIWYTIQFTVNPNYGEDIHMGSEVVIGTVPLWDSCVPQYTSVVTEEPNASSGRPSQEPPPPSYEEYVMGRVSIMEDGDNEHTRGQLNWAPAYPIYNLPPPPAYHELEFSNRL